MIMVNMHEAKTQLSKLVERAAAGEEVVIAKAGTPVAKLVPYAGRGARRVPGGWKGKVWIAPDFDELPPDLLAAFEGDDE
jgi:prevent-host-death family protein